MIINPLPLALVKNLYYKEGWSSVEIGKKFNVSPWVVLRFMRRNNLQCRTRVESNANKFDRKPLTFSIKNNLSVREKELKIAGTLLYWAEGSKLKSKGNNWTVDLVNSDPRMVSLFLKFLRGICRIDEKKLRVQLYCYEDQSVEHLKRYWHELTRISLERFIKPYVRKDFRPEQIGKMKYGLVHIRYCDKKLLIQIDAWIKEYCKKFKIVVE